MNGLWIAVGVVLIVVGAQAAVIAFMVGARSSSPAGPATPVAGTPNAPGRPGPDDALEAHFRDVIREIPADIEAAQARQAAAREATWIDEQFRALAASVDVPVIPGEDGA